MSTSRGAWHGWAVLAAMAAAAVLDGCILFSQNIRTPPQLNGPKVTVRQFSPPDERLPADVRTLAVACFGGRSEADRRWAAAVSAAVSERIADNLRQFPRHGLVMRGGPSRLLGEPPPGEASTQTAADLGRRAAADAVVTGNVAVGGEPGRTVLDVQFALVASRDGRVLDRWGYRTRYRPQAPSAGPRPPETVTLEELLAEGPGARQDTPVGPPPPAREVLPREAAAAYAERITPHWQRISVPLASGGGEFGDAGRSAAAAGKSLEALLNFRRSTVRDERDPGAWYNVGVMYEARGEWAYARDAYRTAVNIYETVPFRRGLQRVERELARQSESTVAGG